MDCSLLNEDVLGAVRQNLGCDDPDDESRDDRIADMGKMEVLERFLEWEGRTFNEAEKLMMSTRR